MNLKSAPNADRAEYGRRLSPPQSLRLESDEDLQKKTDLIEMAVCVRLFTESLSP